MTSSEIRQSFLDFFREKQHSVVPSASLLPQSPGLLFTNAGMNQFVPYFLGEQSAIYSPPRATNTQKCIRAGGKHNDLEDVGYDTYHHTLFEMLGNWSFGDYFKKEAIDWAWELLVDRWEMPPARLYATVYSPAPGEPSQFDQEAYDLWVEKFRSVNLDPDIHIINGTVKDNFWMMGDTGPCGPCSEIHIDLTPKGDTAGKLVNADSDLCIELWNLVFIQSNAESDGTFRDLPAKHVDTGMGFERAVSVIQNTKNFTDFSQKPTNYNTDVFAPLFEKLEEISGKTYQDIYPDQRNANTPTTSECPSDKATKPVKEAIAFRVIADHVRTLALSIADGILPGNTGRNYVLRRILRRAVRYGRNLGFTGKVTFLPQLIDPLVTQLAYVFPEIATKADIIKATLQREETSFNQTLDRGLIRFDQVAKSSSSSVSENSVFPANEAFKLYDTYGFPIDLTQLLAREHGMEVDMSNFEALMEEQKNRSRSAQKSETISALDLKSEATTSFCGFDNDECQATVLELHPAEDSLLVITDQTPFYAEMGGQQGDEGELLTQQDTYPVSDIRQIGKARAHLVPSDSQLSIGDLITLRIHTHHRRSIEAHHTATHLLHWAIRHVVSPDASQQGSLVTPDRLRFDFSSGALTTEQIRVVEDKVNACIEAAEPISWIEVLHSDIKDRSDLMQFFGDKYGDLVRVVQIGGQPQKLNGYSMELCGGTHLTNTQNVGLFKIKKEEAIAAGVRRIEAVVGSAADAYIEEQKIALSEELALHQAKLQKANQALGCLDIPPILHSPATNLGELSILLNEVKKTKTVAVEAEKALKKAKTANAARQADQILAAIENKTQPPHGTTIWSSQNNHLISSEGSPALLQELLNGLKKKQFANVAFLIVDDGDKLYLGALCGSQANATGHGAGDLIKELAPLAGGKGGGAPDQARGAAPNRKSLPDLLKAAQKAIS